MTPEEELAIYERQHPIDPVIQQFTQTPDNDELRHKVLDKYLNDPSLDLDHPNVRALLERLGLTTADGKPIPKSVSLNQYFRGSNPPPNEELYPGMLSIPKGTVPIARAANLYDMKPEPRPPQSQREYQHQWGEDLYNRMKQRIILDYFNGILNLPMKEEPDEEKQPPSGGPQRAIT